MGYPVVVRQAPVVARMSGFRRTYGRRGLGQTNPFSGIINAAENLAAGLPVDAPEAGGGFVDTNPPNADGSQTVSYVDSNGQSAIMTVPAQPDGSPPTSTQIQAAVNATGAGTTPPIIPPALQIPKWVPWVVGGVLFLVLLGYSGVGKLIPQMGGRRQAVTA